MGTRSWSTRALFALWVTCLAFVGGLPGVSPIASPVEAQAAGTGSISGTVTNNGGEPLAGVEVQAQAWWGDWYETTTDAGGHYEFSGLHNDRYRILFKDPTATYAGEYYDGSGPSAGATWVQVSDGEALAGIDATLEVGGLITGTVLDEAGNPFARSRICVTNIFVPTPPCHDGAADGTYEVGGLATGDYIVQLRTWEADGTYRTMYYPGVHEWNDMVRPEVVVGQTTAGIDFTIDRTVYGTFAGRVVDQDDQAFEYSEVCFEGPVNECVEVDDTGSYKMALLPGDYLVHFRADYDNFSRYYDGTPGGTEEWDDALPVTLAAGDAITGMDAIIDLSVYGTMAGTVLQPDGSPFDWGFVCVEEGPTSTCTNVEDDGSYIFEYLEAGDYLVRFEVAPEGTVEYYDGVEDPDLATRVTVVSGESVTGIDAQYPAYGHVEGRITGPGGSPVEGALIGLFGPDDTWVPSYLTETQSDGHYYLEDVRTGHYRVVVVPPAGSGLVSAWYAPGGGSTTIEVSEGNWTEVDLELIRTGAIAGTITDPSGNPVAGVEVRLRAVGSPWAAATAISTTDGSYQFNEVQPGDYVVRYLVPDGSTLSSGWFNGVDTGSEAGVISIASGDAVTADQVLRWSRSLTGTVTGPGSTPVAGAVVRAYQDTDGIVPTVRTESAADGSYSLANLPRGEFRIQVTPPPQSGLLVGWFGGPNRSTAQVVVIDDASHSVADLELIDG